MTEHQVVIKACPSWGQLNIGTFPDEVPCGASYGAGVKGVLTCLNQAHLLPSAHSCEIVADLFGQPVAEGTLASAVNVCTAALHQTELRIK